MTRRRRLAAAAALGTVLVLYLSGIGSLPLGDPDEGRYASVGAAMARSGDWVVPRLGGVPYLEKPPLLYWVTAASFRLLGSSELAARLPVALFAVAGVAFLFLLAWRGFGLGTGVVAAAILATSPAYFAMGRIVTPDMLLTLGTTAALVSFFLAAETGVGWGYWLFWAFSALAVLAKGPVGMVLTGLVVAAYVAATRRPRLLAEMRPLTGLALAAAIAVPWFLLVQERHPAFLEFFVVKQHLARYLDGGAEHREPLLYFVPVLLGGFAPWSAFLPLAAWPDPDRCEGERRLEIFLWLWAGVVVAFFTLSKGKLVPYVLPAFPPLALLVARAWARFLRAPRETTFARSMRAAAVVAAVAALALAVAIRFLAESSLARAGVSASGPLAALVVALTVVPGAGIALLLWLAWNDRRAASLTALVLTAASFFLLAVAAASVAAPTFTAKPLALTLARRLAPGDRVVLFRTVQQSVEFYAGVPPVYVAAEGELRFGASLAPDPARFRKEPAALAELMDAADPTWGFWRVEDAAEAESLLRTPPRLVARNARFVLAANAAAARHAAPVPDQADWRVLSSSAIPPQISGSRARRLAR